VLVNEINGIINSDKLSRSYDDLYPGVTFWDTGQCHNVSSITYKDGFKER